MIAEKPSVGRDIARVLHCSKNIPGALEGDKYIVTWALGHLVTLADPEEYDKKYSKWDMETLPMMPEKMQLVVIRQTAKQYGLVKKQLRLHPQFRLAQEFCIQEKNGSYLFIIEKRQ